MTIKLFISYRHTQKANARDIEQQLEDAGFKVFLDQSDIEPAGSISAEVKEGLASSHAMLILFSNDYSDSRFCQFELTTAYIAALKAGPVNKRIFVLNLDHNKPDNQTALDTLPIELQDALHLPNDYPSLIRTIEEQAAELSATEKGTLGELGAFRFAPHYGHNLTSSPRFVGREQYLWQLHTALQQTQNPMITGQTNPDLAEVSGMGGIGKTLLAEEYALRFAAAYPGGIFWLDAYGSFDAKAPNIETFKAACAEQFRQAAIAFGLQPAHDADFLTLQHLIRQKMQQQGERCLWIVDDIPSGLANHLNEIKQWFSPCPELAPTLVTTRSREYNTIGTDLPLDVLDQKAAYQLLVKHLGEQACEKQKDDANKLIEKLGHHSLALDIAGSAIKDLRQPIAEYLEELEEDNSELLDVPDEIVSAVPSGCEKSIVLSLQKSIQKLSDNGLDFLRLAANLAPAPIKQSMVVEVLVLADELSETKAKKQARLALLGCEKLSLTKRQQEGNDQTEQSLWSVHALVSEVIKLIGESEGKRASQLKIASILYLADNIKNINHGTDHHTLQKISSEIEHARHLVRDIQSEEQHILLTILTTLDHYRGNPKLAVVNWKAIRQYRELTYGENHPETLRSMNNLAGTLETMGDYSGAKELLEDVLERSRVLLGEGHIDTLKSMDNLASTLQAMGNHREVKLLREHALECFKGLLGENHPDTLICIANYASTLKAMGDFNEAKVLLEEVLERFKAQLLEDHPDAMACRGILASTLKAMENYSGAKELQEDVYEHRKLFLGENHPDTLASMNNLSHTLWQMSEHNSAVVIRMYEQGEAIRLMTQVNQGWKECFGIEHPHTLLSQKSLIRFFRESGQADIAQPLIDELQETLRNNPELARHLK